MDAETWMLRHESDTWILQRILRFEDAETWIRRQGSCRGPWNIKMMRHESETWILQRILRYKWMLIYGSGDMDLAEVPEIHVCWHMNPETWISQRILRYIWMFIYGSRDMDLAEEPEIHMDAYIRIRRHGSCRGSWDIYGRWDMNPETWILQRIVRYMWMLIYGSGDMDLAEVPEIHMDAETWAQRRGSCRGSILVDAETWIRRHGSCRESWDTKMLRHESRHGSCRGSWDIKMLRHEC